MPLQFPDFTLRLDDVGLRPLTADDAGALAAAAAESREQYQYNPVPDGLEEAVAYVGRALAMRASGQRFPFAIEWQGRIVGSTSYADFQPWEWPADCASMQRRNRPDAVEIGYTWLAASAQRTGCNRRAKLLLLEHAFGFWQVHRVSLRTDERNQSSRRAIEGLGAKLDGIRRGDMPGRDGTVRNSAYYSILAAEWPQLSARLRDGLAPRSSG